MRIVKETTQSFNGEENKQMGIFSGIFKAALPFIGNAILPGIGGAIGAGLAGSIGGGGSGGIGAGLLGGGVSSSSAKSLAAQQAANAATQQFILQQATQGRGDISSLFPQAQDVSRQGFQSALDLIGLGVPQQLGAFQQGNVGAQQAISSTLPQIQNAILGLPVDFGQFQPQQLNIDTSFLQGLQAPQIQQIQPTQQTALPSLGVIPTPTTPQFGGFTGFTGFDGFSGGPGPRGVFL